MDLLQKYWAEALLIFMTFAGILFAAIIGVDVILLTPLYILMNVGLLLYRIGVTKKVLLMLAVAAFVGYVAELIGVKTGLLFGDYSYGSVLSIEIFEVPLLIGIMWGLVMLSIWSLLPVEKLGWKSVPLAGFIAVIYDFALEHFATRFDLWSWAGSIPFSNAVGWFITGSAIAGIYLVTKKNIDFAPIAAVTLVVHTVFFALTTLLVG